MMFEFIGWLVGFGVIFFAVVWGVGLTCFAIREWLDRKG